MIEESVKNSETGVGIAGEVGKMLEEITVAAGKVNDLVAEINAASQEQSQGIEQINTAVNQMDKVTQQNAANAEESASASEELSAQAEQMNGVVGDLTALVGGAAADMRAKTMTSAGGLRQHAETKTQPAHKMAHTVSSHNTKAKPEKALPLTEEETATVGAHFDEFSE